jgi:hypothetical protein
VTDPLKVPEHTLRIRSLELRAPVPGPTGPQGPTGATGPQGPKGDPGTTGGQKISFYVGSPTTDANSRIFIAFPGLTNHAGAVATYNGPYASIYWSVYQITTTGIWFFLSRGDSSGLPNQAHTINAIAWGS